MISNTRSFPRAVTPLATVVALRILALMMLMPVLSVYAAHLRGATPTLMGLAMGIYGLVQVFFQLPMGWLSDRYPRQHVIALGLIMFMVGSVVCAYAHSVAWLILGRALQGMAAIGSAAMALLADMTTTTQRPLGMAILGMSIGIAFTLAMGLGPFLQIWLTVPHLFLVSAMLVALSLVILYVGLPVNMSTKSATLTVTPQRLCQLYKDRYLWGLSYSALVLHATLAATFVVLPFALIQQGFLPDAQWKIYIPTLLIGCLALYPVIRGHAATRMSSRSTHDPSRQHAAVKFMWVASVGLFASQWVFVLPNRTLFTVIGLILFFAAFTVMETLLPTLVSEHAPQDTRGAVLGIYTTTQFFGIFIGGVLGGYVYGQLGMRAVFIVLALFIGSTITLYKMLTK